FLRGLLRGGVLLGGGFGGGLGHFENGSGVKGLGAARANLAVRGVVHFGYPPPATLAADRAGVAGVTGGDFERCAGAGFQRNVRNDEKFREKIAVLFQNGKSALMG